ncbi:hypothetical protein CRG98_017485 [Punica granatum]|uniref:Mitochondrial mRNA-processing protein COX24 C-terminal domain-containing protein n=1 Tax=Punica granatum TaxID=22663 RepID=A0A2I0K0N7_PUNGR|nr:hypothetical protein CRG98_017485 [Punica granatum]
MSEEAEGDDEGIIRADSVKKKKKRKRKRKTSKHKYKKLRKRKMSKHKYKTQDVTILQKGWEKMPTFNDKHINLA